MATASTISTTQSRLPPMVYRISVDEYDRMVALGVLKDPRVELINGILVKKVSKNPSARVRNQTACSICGADRAAGLAHQQGGSRADSRMG